MKILISGASGFIGRYLIDAFRERNDTVVALSRHPQRQQQMNNVSWRKWQNDDPSDWQDDLENSDIVINLIGASLADKRWTDKRKEVLLHSRVDAAKTFVKAFNYADSGPAMYIQSSAIGYYAPAPFSNEESPAGNDFLAGICLQWEEASAEIEEMGCNRILLRSAPVIADDSMIIKKFRLPFKLFIGGHLGSGQQIMNWIHITDVVQSILFVIENSKTSQIFNLSAPHPVTMEVFCKKLGQRMKRPSWLHVPAFVLKMIFGEMAEETMLKGHKVLPENLLKSGYDFTYADIEMALNQLESL